MTNELNRPGRKFTDEELISIMKEHPEYSNRCIARHFGVDESTIRFRKKKLAKSGWSPEHNWTNTVPDGYKVSGVSQFVDGEGNVLRQWVKSSEDKERMLEIMKQSIQAMVDDLPKLKPVPINNNQINQDLMAVYPLGDPHVGMLAWEQECGDSWDLKIAEQVYCTIFNRVVKSTPSCDKAVIVNLGDFFHSDNMEAVTSRSGHHLDQDGRYAKMAQVGVKIIRQMITAALEHHKEVTVINCIGNHDDTGSLFLSILLKHVYENEPRVIIDDRPSPFHYVRHGKVLLGAHHGHTCKMDRLPGVMAADRYKDWGETEHRYWLTGHIHKSSVYKDELGGCSVESFRTLAAKDSFATYGGWRSGRNTQSIVYHKDLGEIERHTVDISYMQHIDK